MKGWIPALLVLAGLAVAVPPQPIVEGPDAASLPQFFGQPATPRPVAVPDPPRRRTVYKRLAGEGLGHNNNYAPVTLGPDGTAYVGTLGGLVSLGDKQPPAGGSGGRKGLRHLRLHVRRLGRRRERVRVMGGGTRLVRRVDFVRGRRRVARDRRRPFRRVIRVGPRRERLRARVVLLDGRRVVRSKRVRRARTNG